MVGTMNFKKSSGTDPIASMPPPSNDQIAALAHALWIDRGRLEGGDLEHWFEAERQLRGPERSEVKKMPDLPSVLLDPFSRNT